MQTATAMSSLGSKAMPLEAVKSVTSKLGHADQSQQSADAVQLDKPSGASLSSEGKHAADIQLAAY